MKITINGRNYTATLDAAHTLTIERKLNEPAICEFWLSPSADGSLPVPSRNQPIEITGDDSTTYFTGYLAGTPMPEYAGMGISGPRYRIALRAVGDELLLDQLQMTTGKGAAGETAGAILKSLVTRTGGTSLSTNLLAPGAPVSYFAPESGAPWSRSAGQVASQARAAYSALNGALTLAGIPRAVHALNETDGSLNLTHLSLTAGVKRALANDMTVCGEHEPAAYVTEYFSGDGVTTQFSLGAEPYSLPASRSTIIHELFNESQIDPRNWGNPGGAGYFSLGPSGLVMAGSNGVDGDTLLTWLDQIEMGGTLLLEATGVSLAPGSTGILAGFFVGLETQNSCTAGFLVSAEQGTGAVTLEPIVQGSPAGTSYAVNPANQYNLRVRVHCPEIERSLAVYRSFGDDGAISTGGQVISAGASVLMDLEEVVNGVAGMPVTLYEGSIADLPPACWIVAASSLNLHGTMRGLNLTSLGSGWVMTKPLGGTPTIRRMGSTAQGAECQLERSGKLVFYTGFAPSAGEQIAVNYRSVGRAVGRGVNTERQQSLAASGLPATSSWVGSVTNPAARSSQDCRSAAQAMVQAAAGTSAVWSGTYKATRASFSADVWPGDALQLTAPSTNLNVQVVVRNVKLSYQSSYPDLVEYAITFANDWADDLAIKTSAAIPADTWLPAPSNYTPLGNLNALTVTALSGNTVTINTGAAAPVGGGFEIRRRDFCFMPGEDPDLVMRGSQPTMTFTRTSASDRYYIRMFDGASPPNYSEFSTALLINLPLGS